LIKKQKTLESQLAERTQKQDEDPFINATPTEENPFKEIGDLAGLQKKHGEVTNLIEWSEDILDDATEEPRDAVIHEEDGKRYTKGEIRKLLRNARTARDKHLPGRYQQLQKDARAEADRDAHRYKAQELFGWLKEDGNALRKEYEAVLADPDIAELARRKPSVELILAHAADSINRHRTQKGEAKAPPMIEKPIRPAKLEPPANPGTNAATPTKGTSSPVKALQALQAEFDATGNPDVLTEIYAMQI